MSLIVVMVVSFLARRSFRAKLAHQIVDDSVGVFMPLGGQMEIDHGGVQAAVAKVLLNAADIDAGLQQVGSVAVPQGMDGDPFSDIELRKNPTQSTLNGLFVHRGFSCWTFFGASPQAGEYP